MASLIFYSNQDLNRSKFFCVIVMTNSLNNNNINNNPYQMALKQLEETAKIINLMKVFTRFYQSQREF